MKLLLMPDQHVGFQITQWLIEEHCEDILIIVCLSKNEIYKIAQKAQLPCIISGTEKEIIEHCQKEGIVPDMGLLAWWPKIVQRSLLELPKHGFINTHPSLLPYNRGKHYNFWALVEQAPFGVTLHFIDEGVDTGDIIDQRAISYDWEDTGVSLYRKAQETIIELFKDSYPTIRKFGFKRKSQSLDAGSFHLAKEIDLASYVDLEKFYKARDLLNLLRARTFPGYPACWFEEGDKQFEVRVEIKRKTS